MTPIRFHQETYIRDLNLEFENLGSTKDVDYAQAATATLHKAWLDSKLVDVSTVPKVPKGMSNLFSSGRAQREKLEIEKHLQARKAREAPEKYHEQGEPRKGNYPTDLT